MTDEELRSLVARNAQAIDRLEQTVERNAQAIDRLEQAIERNEQAISRLEQAVERNEQAISRLEQTSASTGRQLELVAEQIRSLADNQAINESRFTRAERQIQGIYDLFGTIAREQEERSQLIDRQIQALIDERRRS
ncbi:MAG: hypothetical protein WBB01_20320 [Phormidesmis sp.]